MTVISAKSLTKFASEVLGTKVVNSLAFDHEGDFIGAVLLYPSNLGVCSFRYNREYGDWELFNSKGEELKEKPSSVIFTSSFDAFEDTSELDLDEAHMQFPVEMFLDKDTSIFHVALDNKDLNPTFITPDEEAIKKMLDDEETKRLNGGKGSKDIELDYSKLV